MEHLIQTVNEDTENTGVKMYYGDPTTSADARVRSEDLVDHVI